VCEWIGKPKNRFCKLFCTKTSTFFYHHTLEIFFQNFFHFKGIIVLHKWNIFSRFSPTTKLSCKVMVDYYFAKKKTKVFPKAKKTPNILCCVHHLSMLLVPFPPSRFWGVVFTLDSTLDIRPLFVFLLPFPCGLVLFSFSNNEAALSLSLSLSLSFGWTILHFCDTTKVLHENFLSFASVHPNWNSSLLLVCFHWQKWM